MNIHSPKTVLFVLRGRFRPRSLDLFNGQLTRRQAVADGLSGLTVGLIALPLALAFGVASIPAGTTMPFPAPAVGLFTAIIAGFLISALGGSRVQIGGPTAAFIPILLMIVGKYGYDGLLLSTIMAGVILIVMGAVRMGTLIKFIPYPVTSGFTTGIAVSVMASQAPAFFGINQGTVPGEFLEKIPWLLKNLPHLNPVTFALAAGCVLFIHFWPRLGYHRRVPGSIIAMVAATVLVTLWGLDASAHVATVGSAFGPEAIPRGLPPFHWPVFTLGRVRELIAPATTIAILCSIESLLSAVVADGLINDRHDANTELIAQGVANIVCPLFCGLPATGAIARTSANVKTGGRSPLAGMVHAVTLLLIVLVFSRYAQFVPMAAIAGVLIIVAFRMGEWHEFTRLRKMPRSDAAVLLTTFGLTVIFDLVVAVEIGMVLAAILFIRRVAETTEISQVTHDDELETPEQLARGKKIPEGVLVYRIFGPFFFGAAEKMEDAILRIERLPRVLILRMQLVPAMDATALNALESVVERIQKAGGHVVISGLHHQPLDMMRKAGFVEQLGRKNIRAHFDKALERAVEIMREEDTPPPSAAP
ncbi:MAG: STAS domain-containing protein [Verrucomicrobia bacterium]|nr:STAS domain-containing protein [Verrucomicrobiota bacterium]